MAQTECATFCPHASPSQWSQEEDFVPWTESMTGNLQVRAGRALREAGLHEGGGDPRTQLRENPASLFA